MSTLTRTRRLLVTRRDPETASYETVGELAETTDGKYSFQYHPHTRRPMPGMPDLSEVYTSSRLFPTFDHRVISPRRADHDGYLNGLNLPPDATPFEVLARSGGRSAVDTYELTPVPEPGPVELLFLVHGIRHLEPSEQDAVDQLQHGDKLELRLEPENPVDDQAVLVTRLGCRLGWVPSPLVPYIRQIMTSACSLNVERLNPPEAGFHMRLLVKVTGTYKDLN